MRFCEGLHDPGPGPREVAPVVAAAARSDDPAFAILVGEPAQRRRGLCVRFFGPAKVRYRIALEAVGAALHDDELWPHGVQVGLDLFPGFTEVAVIRARRKRDIQLRATCPARAGLLGSAGAGVEKASVFVEVGEQQIGVVLETVKDTVTVMGIDIDVGNRAGSRTACASTRPRSRSR